MSPPQASLFLDVKLRYNNRELFENETMAIESIVIQ